MAKKVTQKEIVLDYLQNHVGITSMDAFEMGITRLSAVIYQLRRKGFLIENVERQVTNRYGRKVYFDEYRLVKK